MTEQVLAADGKLYTVVSSPAIIAPKRTDREANPAYRDGKEVNRMTDSRTHDVDTEELEALQRVASDNIGQPGVIRAGLLAHLEYHGLVRWKGGWKLTPSGKTALNVKE